MQVTNEVQKKLQQIDNNNNKKKKNDNMKCAFQ